MSDLALSQLVLALALIIQVTTSGLAFEIALRKTLPAGDRLLWLGLALGSLLFALHHGYTLELALRVGLYDLRQALLAGLASLLLGLGLNGIRRRLS